MPVSAATASVDPENEHLIQEAISELTHGKTIITIAQKGTHTQLINQEGIYRDFVRIREQAEGWQIQ